MQEYIDIGFKPKYVVSTPIYEPDLFEDFDKRTRLLSAIDRINDRFGEFTVKSATLLGKHVRRRLFNPLRPVK